MLDAYGRKVDYLRLSVTDLCDLRCRYCMPETGVCKRQHADMLSEDEMIAAVRAAASVGFEKLRITGGEPLVKPNILSICRRAAEVGGIREVCLTTNGTALDRLARPLHEAGVRRVNISLDTLNREKYAWITRRDKLSDALGGLEAALDAGFDKVKINTVLMGGFNDDEIEALAALTLRYRVDVRFIELMPMAGSEVFPPEVYIPNTAVIRRLPDLEDLGQTEGVARLYRLPEAKGNIGLISPVSEHFCGSCSRLRLTADGKLKPCLHDPREFSVKGLDEAAMAQVFREAIAAKPACHGRLDARNRSESQRSMNRIGG